MTKTDNNRYIAVIGDAIASRRLEGRRRGALQTALRAALDEVNTRWERAVAAGFAVALGDQFEGLLEDAAALWDIVHYLRAELKDVDWIVACGRGAVSTPLAATALEVDGPCFHLARETLDRAKQERVVFAPVGFADAAAGLAQYYSALYWSWTARQREVASLLRVMEPAAVAARLEVDRSAISHVTGRLSWRSVAAGDAAFRRALET